MLDRITTLVGISDSGKSAVLRAIDWCVFNRGTTGTLLRRTADHVSVQIDVDGHTVERLSKGNAYRLDNVLFNTINRTIPPEIVTLFKMAEDNVQRQHDNLYWFTANGSALISHLNKIVDLTKLEQWIGNGKSIERKHNDRLKYLQERERELEDERTQLARYRAIDFQLGKLEASEKAIQDIKQRQAQIQALVNNHNACTVQIEQSTQFSATLEAVVKKAEDVFAVISKQQRLAQDIANNDSVRQQYHTKTQLVQMPVDGKVLAVRQRHTQLTSILQTLQEVKQTLVQRNTLLQAWQPIEKAYNALYNTRNRQLQLSGYQFKAVPVFPISLQQTLACTSALAQKRSSLQNVLQAHASITEAVALSQQEYITLDAEFKKHAAVCPLCGRVRHE